MVEEKMFILSGKGPHLSTILSTPLQFSSEDNLVVALTKITFYNSFCNVQKERNNQLLVIVEDGVKKREIMISIPQGAYEIDYSYSFALWLVIKHLCRASEHLCLCGCRYRKSLIKHSQHFTYSNLNLFEDGAYSKT